MASSSGKHQQKTRSRSSLILYTHHSLKSSKVAAIKALNAKVGGGKILLLSCMVFLWPFFSQLSLRYYFKTSILNFLPNSAKKLEKVNCRLKKKGWLSFSFFVQSKKKLSAAAGLIRQPISFHVVRSFKANPTKSWALK